VAAIVGALVHRQPLLVRWLVAPIDASAVLVLRAPASPMRSRGRSSRAARCRRRSACSSAGDSATARWPWEGRSPSCRSREACTHRMPPADRGALRVGGDARRLVASRRAQHVRPRRGRLGLSSRQRHRYPHRVSAPVPATPPPDADPAGVSAGDVTWVRAHARDTYDIAPEDLAQFVRAIEARPLARLAPSVPAAEAMSCGATVVDLDPPAVSARELLLRTGAPSVARRRRGRPGRRRRPPVISSPPEKSRQNSAA
jgi:hypothetical protein